MRVLKSKSLYSASVNKALKGVVESMATSADLPDYPGLERVFKLAGIIPGRSELEKDAATAASPPPKKVVNSR